MKMACRLMAGFLAFAMVVPPAAFAQSQNTATAEQQQMLLAKMEEAQQIAAIEADKAGFVGELLARFASTAADKGHDAFISKGTRKLMRMSGRELRALSERAKDYDTFYKLVFEGYVVNSLGELTQDLVFYPMPACRIYDSRSATAGGLGGPMAPGTQRSVSVNDSTSVQGGANPDCYTVTPDIDNDPPALAITLTAASPTGAGNLRTFPTGGSVPNAAMLTYVAGTTISTGAITASCVGCSPELTVRNQGAGNTDVVIDVVGYFHAAHRSALNCQTVSTTAFNIPANSYFTFSSPVCPAGTTLTGGGFDSGFNAAEIWVYATEPNGAGTAWTCEGKSQYAFDWPHGDCHAVCCSTPGR